MPSRFDILCAYTSSNMEPLGSGTFATSEQNLSFLSCFCAGNDTFCSLVRSFSRRDQNIFCSYSPRLKARFLSKQNLDQHTETLIKADEQVRWEGRCGVMPISDIRPALPRPPHRSVQLSRAQAEQVVRIHGRSGRFLEFRIDSYE